MESQIKTFSYPNGEIQRVQLVRLEDWSALEYLRPAAEAGHAAAQTQQH